MPATVVCTRTCGARAGRSITSWSIGSTARKDWRFGAGSLGDGAASWSRQARPEPTGANQYWSMDFMHDALANGRTLRIFTLIDVHTRECLALKPATGFSGAAVAQVLADVGVERPLPQRILVDNGTEFTSKALDAWAYWNKVKLDFSRRGRPGTMPTSRPSTAWSGESAFRNTGLGVSRRRVGVLEDWKEEYNNDRPHGSLRQMPPARYRAGGISAQDRDEPETRRSGGPN